MTGKNKPDEFQCSSFGRLKQLLLITGARGCRRLDESENFPCSVTCRHHHPRGYQRKRKAALTAGNLSFLIGAVTVSLPVRTVSDEEGMRCDA
jgi:hypothetical protein